MWCPQCQTDVSGEASADGTRLACAACGTEILAHVPAEKPGRSPKDLLSRWAKEDAIDGIRPPGMPPEPRHLGQHRRTDRTDAPRGPWWSRILAIPSVGFALAYGGVALVAFGALIVLVTLSFGHSPAIGWVLAVLGHLLVLLGVVTLVTHGLEQSAADTAERLDCLNERLVRIEQAQRALAGPHWEARSGSRSDGAGGLAASGKA